MIAAVANGRVPRYALFVILNVAVFFVVVALFVAPLLSHFADRSEAISDNAAQLAHFQKVIRDARVSARKVRRTGDPFLSGDEERVASADLQAALKSIAMNAGVGLRGIRGVSAARSQQLRMVAVNVEVEGSLQAVRDMIASIETQTPLLFVTAVSFRSVSDGEDGPIRAELRVQGAMRERSQSPDNEAALQ